MTDARLILTFAAGVVLAVGGYFLIGFACRYGVLATIMTGRVPIPGAWLGVPYRTLLAVEIALILYAFYVWMQWQGFARSGEKPFANPALLATISVGIAAIGFLSIIYPCPVPIDLWLLLSLEIPIGGAYIPYWCVLALAGCLLVYAAHVRARPKQA